MAHFEVSSAAAHELLPACRLLFADGRAERSRDLLLSDSHTTGLFVARGANGRLHAAALVQVLPGALGVAWPVRGDSIEAINAVATAAREWLCARGVKVCQAFAAASEVADVRALERHGFRHTTQLVLMRREVDRDRDGHSSFDLQIPLSTDSYGPETANEFRAVLLGSHEGSLDCPELTGSRDPDELLASYSLGALPFRSNPFTSRLMALHGREPVGALLTDGSAEPGAVELSYLGLLPSARGRGFGDWLVRLAAFGAARAHAQALTLSVDARNGPAMKLYARHGFVEYDRREVWLATWPA